MNNSKRKRLYRLSLLNNDVNLVEAQVQVAEPVKPPEPTPVIVQQEKPVEMAPLQNGLKEIQEEADKLADKKKLKLKKPVEEDKPSDV